MKTIYQLPWQIEDEILCDAEGTPISDYMDWCEEPENLSLQEFAEYHVDDGIRVTVEEAIEGLRSAGFVGGAGRHPKGQL